MLTRGDDPAARAGSACERAAQGADKQPAVQPEVLYDLAVIRLAAGDRAGAAKALARAVALNPKLKTASQTDLDLRGLRE